MQSKNEDFSIVEASHEESPQVTRGILESKMYKVTRKSKVWESFSDCVAKFSIAFLEVKE